MCLFKQDDGRIVVPTGLRHAAVLTVISTPRLRSFFKHLIPEERPTSSHDWFVFGNFCEPRSPHVTWTPCNAESSQEVFLYDELRNQ